jgi:digeranylgeranylglycerophospholipid reductase
VTTSRLQVVIVGAGAAGLLAALRLSEAGLDCVLLEARRRGQWGSRYAIELDSGSVLNGLLPAPIESAILHEGRAGADLCPPSRDHCRNVTPLPVYAVRLWKYQRQLLELIERAGVDVRFDCRVTNLGVDDRGRTSLSVLQGDSPQVLVADLAVLASGNNHSFDRELYAHFHLRRKILEREYLLAQHDIWEVDPDSVDGNSFSPPGVVNYVIGNEGPISTLGVWISPDKRVAGLLAGSLPVDGFRTPAELLKEVRSGPMRFTKRLSGASGLIPVRRPIESLVAPGLALIGHSGCQVYPMTGCGLGLFGHAALLLAEATRDYCRSGRKLEHLWRYNHGYQSDFGARQAASQVFLEAIRKSPWGSGLIERLFELGLSRADDYLRSLDLGPVLPSPGEMLQRIPGAMALERDKGRYLTACMVRATALSQAYRRFYPHQPDAAKVRSFVARTSKLVG